VPNDPLPKQDPTPQDIEETLQLALDRANQIREMLRQADIPASDITAIALTLVAAHAALDLTLHMNDAWALYLSAYEDAELQQGERMAEAVKRMQNTVREVVQRVFLPGDEKPPTTH